MDLYSAIVISVVEGITEYLPISSTGHMVVIGDLIKFVGDKEKTFEVIIQLGAILAVVCLYWRRFFALLCPRVDMPFSGLRGIWLLFLTTLPACIFGLLLHRWIKTYLFSVGTVCAALIVGGIIMILVESKRYAVTCHSIDELTPRLALGIGFFQCLALWPGFSRSAATIMGGMILGTSRETAASYSFLAAVPVMVAATGFDFIKSAHLFSKDDLFILSIGFIGAFLSALVAIKVFVALLSKISLVPFAYYRFVVAIIILAIYFI